jgi:hypothetical protein
MGGGGSGWRGVGGSRLVMRYIFFRFFPPEMKEVFDTNRNVEL